MRLVHEERTLILQVETTINDISVILSKSSCSYH